MIPPLPCSTLFPYTTLFRSVCRLAFAEAAAKLRSRRPDRSTRRWWDHGKRVHLSSTDRKSTRLNSSHTVISYAVFCLKKKKHTSSLDVQRAGCSECNSPAVW